MAEADEMPSMARQTIARQQSIFPYLFAVGRNRDIDVLRDVPLATEPSHR
jgi:hypothetical protein